jgi:hypothetical protein
VRRSGNEVDTVDEMIVPGAIRLLSIAEGCWSSYALAGGLAAIIVITATGTSVAQDALTAARDLYRVAAYEEALARLDALRRSPHPPEENRSIEQYRAFCLLALGRRAEAEGAIEAVVTAAPSFSPGEDDQSPRVRSAFSEVRRRVLPGIIQQVYMQAKAAFDRHDSQAAAAGFRQVLDLLRDADVAAVANQSPLSEIRTLATGFLDLTAAPKSTPAPAAVPTTPREPQPTTATAVRPETSSGPQPGRIYTIADAEVTPPVVIRESWAALADVFAVRAGVVEIVIDELGAVETAAMAVGVNAVYDRLALSTAKRWRYKPATLNGVTVKFKRVVLLDFKSAR